MWQCSSSRIHFHCYHSPSHHLLLVSENEPLSVIDVLVRFYRQSKSPTHSHSSFNLCGIIIIIIITARPAELRDIHTSTLTFAP